MVLSVKSHTWSFDQVMQGIIFLVPTYPVPVENLQSSFDAFPAYLNRKGGSDGNMSCTVLYSKYDNLRLASVASASKAEYMIGAVKNVHLFMAGNS